MRLAIPALAAALLAAAAPAAAGELEFTPYVWIPGIDGTIETGGGDASTGGDRVKVDFSPEYRIGGAMLNFSWREGRFTAFADWTYANVRATSPSPYGALYSEVQGQIIGNIVQLFSGYAFLQGEALKLDAFIGGRGYGLTGRLQLEPGALASEKKLSSNSVWFDVCTGLRLNAFFARHWAVFLRGDVGAGGSNFTGQWYAGGGYRFHWGGLLAGWRYLYIDKRQGDLQLKLSLSGPVVGVDLVF